MVRARTGPRAMLPARVGDDKPPESASSPLQCSSDRQHSLHSTTCAQPMPLIRNAPWRLARRRSSLACVASDVVIIHISESWNFRSHCRCCCCSWGRWSQCATLPEHADARCCRSANASAASGRNLYRDRCRVVRRCAPTTIRRRSRAISLRTAAHPRPGNQAGGSARRRASPIPRRRAVIRTALLTRGPGGHENLARDRLCLSNAENRVSEGCMIAVGKAQRCAADD